MKRLLPLLLSVLLLVSCGGQTTPGASSSSGAASSSSDTSTVPVQTFDPSTLEGEPSEELLFQMFHMHPRYRNYPTITWAVAEDGAFDLLGLILYEDPEETYCYYLAYVTREFIRPVAIGTEQDPLWGVVGDMTYLGDGVFTFVFTEAGTDAVDDYTVTFSTNGEDLFMKLDVAPRTEGAETTGDAESTQG